MNYRRHWIIENIRLVLRFIDLILFYRFLTRDVGGIKSLKNLILVELGPGPTKLNIFKKLIFKSVVYIDLADYGGTGEVVLADLSKFIPTPNDLQRGNDDDEFFYFADHCVEHLPIAVVKDFLRKYNGAFAFRAPNIRSKKGRIDFDNDITHKTKYDDEDLMRIGCNKNINIYFWNRFYSLNFKTETKRETKCREILIYREKSTDNKICKK